MGEIKARLANPAVYPASRHSPTGAPGTRASQQKEKPLVCTRGLQELAERTGLEPATSGVTGQHSNQLNYRSALETLQALIISEDIQKTHPEVLLFEDFL
jgi:hypothetical protein